MTDTAIDVARPRPLWGVSDVAAYLDIPIKTLYKWRLERSGPPCVRIGKHLRYVPDDVVTWVEDRRDSGR